MKRDRGEYRPIYEALLDGPQFQALSASARLVLLVIKIKSGPMGLRSIPGLRESLQEWTGLKPREVTKALADLQQLGWVQVERSVVWLVRGLEFEPSMDCSNLNHRKHVQRVIDALPSVSLLGVYRERYPEWFAESPAPKVDSPPPSPTHTPSDGVPIALPITSTTTTTSPSTKYPVDTPRETLLAVAANQAIERRWGEQTRPILPGSGSTHQLAQAIEAAGVPVEFAQRSIVRQVEAKADGPPRSMAYFRAGVLADWEGHRTRELGNGVAPVSPLEPAPKPRRGPTHQLDPYLAGADMVLAAVKQGGAA